MMKEWVDFRIVIFFGKAIVNLEKAKNLPIAKKKFTSRSQAMTTKLDKIILEKAMEEREEGKLNENLEI